MGIPRKPYWTLSYKFSFLIKNRSQFDLKSELFRKYSRIEQQLNIQKNIFIKEF